MKKRTYKNNHAASSGCAGQPDISDALRSDPALSVFTFDGLYSVTDGYDLLDSMCCADNGRYYETPIDWKGLTRAFAQSPLHQSALYFKRNVLAGCYIPHPLLSRQAFSAFALDWFVLGNAYLERRSNRLGDPLKLKHVPALNTRRGSDLDTYWFIRQWKDEYEFKAGEVCHIMNPDIHQEIYGMPEYMGRCCPPVCHIRRQVPQTLLRQRIPCRMHYLCRVGEGGSGKHKGCAEDAVTGQRKRLLQKRADPRDWRRQRRRATDAVQPDISKG